MDLSVWENGELSQSRIEFLTLQRIICYIKMFHSVILPTYNEAENLLLIMSMLNESFEANNIDL
jgi:hypothetical protein